MLRACNEQSWLMQLENELLLLLLLLCSNEHRILNNRSVIIVACHIALSRDGREALQFIS